MRSRSSAGIAASRRLARALPGLASGMLLRIAVTPEVLPVVPQLRAEPRPDAFGSLRALSDVGSIHNEGRLPPESPAFFLAP